MCFGAGFAVHDDGACSTASALSRGLFKHFA
jgi:hypothetical protein